MPQLARFQAELFDNTGGSLAGQTVNVRVSFEVAGHPLAPIWQDRDGAFSQQNEFTVTDGKIGFHAQGSVYNIRAWIGDSGAPTLERIWSYMGIGLGQETDINGLTPKGDWSAVATYNSGDYITHNSRTFASIIDGNLNNEPPNADVSDANWQWIPATDGMPGAPGSSDIIASSATSNTIDTPPYSKTWTLDQPNRGLIAGARVRFSSRANPTQDYQGGVVTSYLGNDITVAIDNVGDNAGAGPFTDWNMNLIGEAGEDGQPGATGPAGVTVELDYTWNATPGTTPAAGQVQTSTAPAVGVSAGLHISKEDRNGDDNSADILRWGSSTSTDRGEVRIKATGVAGQWWSAVIDGAAIDNTSHYTFPITFGAKSTAAVADASIVGVGFAKTGDKGEDGTGTGDVIGPASAVDNGFALYDGPSGKLIKDGGTTVANSQLANMAAETLKIGPPGGGSPVDTATPEDTLWGRQTGGNLGPLDGDKAADILQTGTNPVARRGDNNVFTKAQITAVTPLASWTTAWNIFDNNNFRITGLVSGAAGNFPLPAVTGLNANEVWKGEVKFNSQAGTTAGFDAGWEWPGGAAGVPDLSAGGHWTLYVRIENDGTTIHYEAAAVAAWATA